MLIIILYFLTSDHLKCAYLLQKQSDLLLNADDLDAMWVCLRENCVIDDATGAEKVILASFSTVIIFFCMCTVYCL